MGGSHQAHTDGVAQRAHPQGDGGQQKRGQRWPLLQRSPFAHLRHLPALDVVPLLQERQCLSIFVGGTGPSRETAIYIEDACMILVFVFVRKGLQYLRVLDKKLP